MRILLSEIKKLLVTQILLLCVFLMMPLAAHAGDVSINLNVRAQDHQVLVKVSNTGRDPALRPYVKVELDGKTYQKPLVAGGGAMAARGLDGRPKDSASGVARLDPREERIVSFRVDLPKRHGSHPLYTTFYYYNDSQLLSVLTVGYFNHHRTEIIDKECVLPTIRFSDSTELPLAFPHDYRFRLFLPDEIEVEKELQTPEGGRYVLRNKRPMLSSNYGVFTILQTPEDWAIQSTKICETRLITSKAFKRSSFFSDSFVFLAGIFSFLAGAFCYRRACLSAFALLPVSLCRYLFSVFTVSFLYLLFRKAYLFSELILPYLYSLTPKNWAMTYVWSSINILLKRLYFEGGDYNHFFQSLADPLYAYMLVINFFVIFYLIKPEPENDKYWHLLRSVYNLPLIRLILGDTRERSIHWTRLTRLAILTLMVKVFYLPLLTSWSINQLVHANNLIRTASFDFNSVNALMVELLIFVDVFIFSLGYLTELPQLKNKIRSVEPTVFGWFVCLMCYPPFNLFAFQLIDKPLHEYWVPAVGIQVGIATALITVLWAVYVWATIALGWKASNLTNRGIVDSGPYRYIRHPAYVAKVGLWTISSYFMGAKNFFLVLTFIVVYVLRAWTEERHLSLDPDYLEYKKRVRWKIIPGVF